MRTTCNAAAIAGTLLVAGIGLSPALAQSPKAGGPNPAADRTVEQYTCKDVMRESGPNRDIAIAFIHGFLLGKSGSSKFNVDVLYEQGSRFVDYCLDNPKEKAADVLTKIKG